MNSQIWKDLKLKIFLIEQLLNSKRKMLVQMQLQMETCDLDECDFLETRFVEFECFDDYNNCNYNLKGEIILFEDNGKLFTNICHLT